MIGWRVGGGLLWGGLPKNSERGKKAVFTMEQASTKHSHGNGEQIEIGDNNVREKSAIRKGEKGAASSKSYDKRMVN